MPDATARKPTVSFRDAQVEAALAQRADSGESQGLVARRTLARYYDALTREQGGLGLSGGEWDALKAATLSRAFGDNGPYHLHYSLLDAAESGELADDLNVSALVRRIKTWTPMQELAAVELLEGWRRE